MQRPQGYGMRSGLVPVMTERKIVRETGRAEVMQKLFGPDWKEVGKQSLALSEGGPSTGEIITKLNEGSRLTPEEQAVYDANRPLIDTIHQRGSHAFERAVAEGKSTGARENFWATQRPLATRFHKAAPEGSGRTGASAERWTDSRRFHDAPARYDAFKAIEDYVDKVIAQDTYDPMIADAKGFVKHLEQLQEQGLESVEGEKRFVQDFIENQMKSGSHFMDQESFKRNNRHIMNDSIGVGDSFKSKGLIDPLQPKGEIKVTSQTPSGLFKISVDGKPQTASYTFSDILAMKHESTLANVRPVSSIAQFLTTVALGSWVALDWTKFPVAGLSNITRALASESRGYLGEGAKFLKSTLSDPAKRKAWFQEMEPLDVASPGLLEFAKKGKIATPLWNVAMMNVALPDLLQKPILFEAARARLRATNPDWTEQNVKTEALMETALHSDLAGKQFQAPAAQHPLGQLAYLFQKSQLRTFDLINSVWSDTTISNVKRAAKLGVITGVPAATWMGIYYATGGDLGRAVRQSLEFLPFLNVVTSLPGVAAAVDAMDGKTLNRFARRHFGVDTPFIDVRGWAQGKPTPQITHKGILR